MDKEQVFERFKQSFEYLKDRGRIHKQQDLCEPLGIVKSHISEFCNGKDRYFTEGNLKRFAAAYKDYINEEWLLTGKGTMAKPEKDVRPHFEARVAAGFLAGGSEQIMSPELRSMITPFPEYDFTIDVEGDSMIPQIADGDTICCRYVDDRQNPPIGQICVLDTKDGPAVKVIKEVTDDSVILHSLNPAYPDYPVEFNDINRIALVIGVLRILHP